MGWTAYYCDNRKPNGKIDVKAECDKLFHWEEKSDTDDGTLKKRVRVLKSSLIGSIYYAAVEIIKDNARKVIATVVLTSTRMADGCNFAYNAMDESMGPFYYDCPKSILDLLTPTSDATAQKWRQACLEKAAAKKSPTTLSNLPEGSIISCKIRGEDVELFKHAPAYQFKRPFWYCNGKYISVKHIPEKYQVLRIGYTS